MARDGSAKEVLSSWNRVDSIAMRIPVPPKETANGIP